MRLFTTSFTILSSGGGIFKPQAARFERDNKLDHNLMGEGNDIVRHDIMIHYLFLISWKLENVYVGCMA